MKLKLLAATALLACASTGLATTGASAQDVVNLSGQYTCVQGCLDNSPGPAFVTQNGWTMNIVNEAGQPTRAWIDRPGHIWTDNWQEGAIYSPDGTSITFDNGTKPKSRLSRDTSRLSPMTNSAPAGTTTAPCLTSLASIS